MTVRVPTGQGNVRKICFSLSGKSVKWPGKLENLQKSYKGTLLQHNHRKMTMKDRLKWLFSYNSFVKFHRKYIFWSHNMTDSVVYLNLCDNEMCYKGVAQYLV